MMATRSLKWLILIGSITNAALATSFRARIPLTDPRTHWWDDATHPRVYQVNNGRVHAIDYNPSQKDPHGSPNNHAPWRHEFGHGQFKDGDQVFRRKFVRLPEGKKIRVFRSPASSRGERNLQLSSYIQWEYPVGSVVGEVFQRGLNVILIRTRTKVSRGVGAKHWEFGEKPSEDSIPSPQSCTRCHQDTGRHAVDVDPKRLNYYGFVSGSDGIISLSPFDGRKVHQQRGLPVPVNEAWDERLSHLFDLSEVK